MADFTFTRIDNKYESGIVRFDTNAVVELMFDSVPDYTGVKIEIYQSLSRTGWQLCYDDTLRTGLTWCKTLVGVSKNAYYKIVCSSNPTSGIYE